MRHNEGYHRTRGAWHPNERQRVVLDLLAEGRSNAEIAVALDITVNGVKWHVGELVAETGLSDRRELAAWWAEARGPARRLILPLWLCSPRVAVTGSLAAIVVLCVAGWLLWSHDGGETSQSVTLAPEPDEGFISGGPIEPFEPLFENFLIELTVQDGMGRSRVDLRDIDTGELLGSIEAGYRPVVVVRKKARELLVASDTQVDRDFSSIIRVYDLRGYSLTVKQTLDVPERINCKNYCISTILSRDERYLYYGAGPLECSTGVDTSACAVTAVVRLDLEDETVLPKFTELGRNCGIPVLGRVGDSGVVATCRGMYPTVGGWSLVIQPGGVVHELESRHLSPQLSHLNAAGELLLINPDGVVTTEGGDIVGDALPRSLGYARAHYLGSAELGNDRLFIMFAHRPTQIDGYYGFVVFDIETMQVEGHGRVPGAAYYLPQGDSVYVLREGRIEILDLASGRLDVLTDSVGANVEVLLPGG